jgi:hypothetical protein
VANRGRAAAREGVQDHEDHEDRGGGEGEAAGRDDIRRAGRAGDGLYVCVGQIRGHGEELGRVALAACGSRVAAGGLWARVFEGAGRVGED